MIKNKKRGDCFLGLHSDFHCRIRDERIFLGENLNEDTLCEICETLKPEFIQIDCKGHPGYTSYPSQMSNAYPYFKADPLALWRKVTHKYGIKLYMHYSGVYDKKYCIENPEQACKNPDGSLDYSVRFDGDYYDKYFIPQLSELVEKYEVDGFWIDGDCWSVHPDYSEQNLNNFKKKYSIDILKNPPVKKGDEYFEEFMDYTRDEFRRILNYYVDVMHEKYPNVEICSNWAFSDHMPEKICANVDFLSGDLNPENGLNSARYAGRMLAGQGLSWDLMSWDFRFLNYGNMYLLPPKHVNQTMQEAAEVIALGGAYQDNVAQFVDASHDVQTLRNIKPIYDFLRERRDYCFRAKFVPQVAVLVSTYDRYSEMVAPFNREGMDRFIGLTALLCDSGLSLELLGEHNLEDRFSEYPLVVIPELYKGLEAKTVEKLKNYVQNGGSLMLIGSKTCKIFSENGFGFECEPNNVEPFLPGFADCVTGHDIDTIVSEVPTYFSLMDGILGSATGTSFIDAEGEVFGELYNNPRRQNPRPFATVLPFGKGKIAAVGMNLGSEYIESAQYLHRNLIKNMASKLYTPIARIEKAAGMLEIVLLQKDGRLLLQLVNANGNHANNKSLTEDIIPPVVDIEISVALDKEPESVALQPQNKPLCYEYRDGRIYFKIDRVDVHNVVEIK